MGLQTSNLLFFGYKVILLISVIEPIFPIAVEVVPGNKGESAEFRKVIDQFTHYHPEIKVAKVFGDTAFDAAVVLSERPKISLLGARAEANACKVSLSYCGFKW